MISLLCRVGASVVSDSDDDVPPLESAANSNADHTSAADMTLIAEAPSAMASKPQRRVVSVSMDDYFSDLIAKPSPVGSAKSSVGNGVSSASKPAAAAVAARPAPATSPGGSSIDDFFAEMQAESVKALKETKTSLDASAAPAAIVQAAASAANGDPSVTAATASDSVTSDESKQEWVEIQQWVEFAGDRMQYVDRMVFAHSTVSACRLGDCMQRVFNLYSLCLVPHVFLALFTIMLMMMTMTRAESPRRC